MCRRVRLDPAFGGRGADPTSTVVVVLNSNLRLTSRLAIFVLVIGILLEIATGIMIGAAVLGPGKQPRWLWVTALICGLCGLGLMLSGGFLRVNTERKISAELNEPRT